jgi:hypothetical protein
LLANNSLDVIQGSKGRGLEEFADVPAHGLFRAPTVDFFRSAIPEGNRAIQIGHQDSVGSKLQQGDLLRDLGMRPPHVRNVDSHFQDLAGPVGPVGILVRGGENLVDSAVGTDAFPVAGSGACVHQGHKAHGASSPEVASKHCEP